MAVSILAIVCQKNETSELGAQVKKTLSAIFVIVVMAGAVYGFYWLVSSAWTAISNSTNQVSVAILAGFFSIIGAALTVALGRHFDRKKEIEAHFREKKIVIYDEFLVELFKVFHVGDANQSEESAEEPDDLVEFLQEWQRTLLLWGGSNVLRAYFAWISHLKKGNIDAQTFFLMDKFFRALRHDIGQNSTGLEKGAFAHLILRHADLFLSEAKKNPRITLDELAEKERQLGLEN